MQIIEGTALAKLVDYSFGDHQVMWNDKLEGEFKYANGHNIEFFMKAQEFEGKVMTLYIDNLRLYPRPVKTDTENDAKFVNYMMQTNNLLALCSLLPKNGFIIFTGQEDTPIDQNILLPPNVLKVYGVNALFNNDRVIPFPFGVQRKMNKDDNRLFVLEQLIGTEKDPSKLLYINCGIERNEERKPLAKFETNDWCTTRFDKDSKFFPYDRYNEFLSELRDHKFVICPKGHGFDTHRIWETLYMRRVPVMIDHPYFKRLLEGFPVLFVNTWDEVTEELLISNQELYDKAQTLNMDKLDLNTLYAKSIST